MHTRVWKLELRRVNDFIVVEQQIEVESARRMVKIAPTAELLLDSEQGSEHGLWREDCFEGDNGIDKVGLVVNADRCRAVERRSA